jgi:hypothetical protein
VAVSAQLYDPAGADDHCRSPFLLVDTHRSPTREIAAETVPWCPALRWIRLPASASPANLRPLMGSGWALTSWVPANYLEDGHPNSRGSFTGPISGQFRAPAYVGQSRFGRRNRSIRGCNIIRHARPHNARAYLWISLNELHGPADSRRPTNRGALWKDMSPHAPDGPRQATSGDDHAISSQANTKT